MEPVLSHLVLHLFEATLEANRLAPVLNLTWVKVRNHGLVLRSDPHSSSTYPNIHRQQVIRTGSGKKKSRCDRGYPPCSSSLLKPELPSSQQLLVLVPLPDSVFPPVLPAAPGPPPVLPVGARPLLFPGASGFLSSIAGITRKTKSSSG